MSMNIGSIGGFDPTTLYENLFKKVDSNSDGSIDKTEFESAVSSMASSQNVSTTEADAMFKKLDTDGDGKVSEKEMMAALKTAGDQMRANMPPPPPPDDSQNGQTGSLTDQVSQMSSSIDNAVAAGTMTSDEAASLKKELADITQTLAQAASTSTTDTSATSTSSQSSRLSDLVNYLSSLDGTQNGQDTPLTDSQKKTVDSILSKYDASNLTSADVAAINKSFSDAGIQFGKSLGDEIEANGFSIRKMMQLSPPPTDGGTGATSTVDATSTSSTTSTSTTATTAETNGQNAMFSDLLRSLQSLDTSSTASSSDNSRVNDLFSNLVNSLNSSDSSNDDEISSLINNFLQELQTGTQYSQSGSLTASTSTTQSLLAATA